MTAILQPGDRIHLAIPTSQDPQGNAARVTASYARQGVHIIVIDHIEGAATTQVVAVFRGPAPQPDGCLCQQVEVGHDNPPELIRGKTTPYCPIHGKEQQ